MSSILRRRAISDERQNRLSGGPGVRLHRTPFGTTVRFEAGSADFNHPWLTELAGSNAATFVPGFVNQMPAGIDDVPLAGTDKKPAPRLTWSKLQLTDDGIGFFCAEVTCDPKNGFSLVKVEVVQVADPDTDDGKPGKTRNSSGGAQPLRGNRARWPISMLQRRQSGLVEVFQITHFNLTHDVRMSADGQSVLRHFFW